MNPAANIAFDNVESLTQELSKSIGKFGTGLGICRSGDQYIQLLTELLCSFFMAKGTIPADPIAGVVLFPSQFFAAHLVAGIDFRRGTTIEVWHELCSLSSGYPQNLIVLTSSSSVPIIFDFLRPDEPYENNNTLQSIDRFQISSNLLNKLYDLSPVDPFDQVAFEKELSRRTLREPFASFFAHNRQALSKWWSEPDDMFDKNFSHFARWTIEAVHAFAALRFMIAPTASNAIIFHHNIGNRTVSSCFFLKMEYSLDAYRSLDMGLRFLFTSMAFWDMKEACRRFHVLATFGEQGTLTHDLRNRLGTLRNSLLAAYNTQPSPQVRVKLDQVFLDHDDALRTLERLGAISREPVALFRICPKELATQLLRHITHKSPVTFDVKVRKSGTACFLARGSLPVLVSLIAPFVENGIQAQLDLPKFFRHPHCSVSIELVDYPVGDDQLIIEIENQYGQMPEDTAAALHQKTIDERLPSDEEEGGEGIFSAIRLLRSELGGEARLHDFSSSFSGLRWTLRLPVRIVRQESLFQEYL